MNSTRTHHVIGGRTVDGATVLCGNVRTLGTTVHVIDTVLVPPAT